jgi:hypothetical protein
MLTKYLGTLAQPAKLTQKSNHHHHRLLESVKGKIVTGQRLRQCGVIKAQCPGGSHCEGMSCSSQVHVPFCSQLSDRYPLHHSSMNLSQEPTCCKLCARHGNTKESRRSLSFLSIVAEAGHFSLPAKGPFCPTLHS